VADQHARNHGGRNNHSTIDFGSNLLGRRIMILSLPVAPDAAIDPDADGDPGAKAPP